MTFVATVGPIESTMSHGCIASLHTATCLESESYWTKKGYSRWITDMDNTNGALKINSLQTGFLVRADIHNLFGQYLLSVNPDDNYKIVVFDDDLDGLDGRILDLFVAIQQTRTVCSTNF
ncbi:hypothetical protein FN846DRAFT_967139, partial [Sphaerosporella brunnea]